MQPARARLAANHELLLEHIGFAHAIASRYYGDRAELQSVAVAALVDAAASYDPALGKLTTHAYPRIRGALREHIEGQKRASVRDAPEAANGREPPLVDTDALASAVAQLPPRLRHVVERQLAGATLAQVGAELGVSAPAVHKRLARAHVALRGLLENAEPSASAMFGACWQPSRSREARCSACFSPPAAWLTWRDWERRREIAELFATAQFARP